MAQTVEICLPNLVGFVEGNAPMIFFTPLNVREVELRAYMEGWEANCVDKQVELLAASAALKRI
jgi:hypothetical protein